MNRLSRIHLAIAALILSVILATNSFAQEPSVKVVGYSTAILDPTSEYQQAYARSMQPGTNLSILVELKNLHITEITAEDNAFTMTDSTGTKMNMTRVNINFMATIADDAASVVFPVASEDIASKNADSIDVKGKITCIVGENLKEEEIEVKIAKGTELKLGGIPLKITEVGDHYEEGSQVMTIESNKALKAIKSLEAIGEGGKATALKSVVNSSWGFGDDKTYRQELVIAGKAADVKKLKVIYFQDLKKVEVPVDVKVSFSLSK